MIFCRPDLVDPALAHGRERAKLLIHQREDLLVNRIDGLVAFDDENAARFPRGYLAIFQINTAVEIAVLALEAPLIGCERGGTVVAAARTCERTVEVSEQEDGQIGLETAAHHAVHAQHDITAKLTASALIRLGGIGVAIAKDDAALVESGANDFRDGLRAIGKHQPQLGHRSEFLGLGIEKDGADSIADVRASRLARHHNRVPRCFKVSGQFAQLGGFAGTVRSLEGKEEAARSRARQY